MAVDKSQFLKFSAYSIRDAIIRSLASNSKFTDEIYPGSNLQVLIDIISYMYQVLVGQLNFAASESMFADTQIFENIVKLVQLLDYNVKGCSPSSFSAYFTTGDWDTEANDATPVIYPYSYITTNRTDSNGRQICFSTRDSYFISPNTRTPISLYNGRWQLYPVVFTASGIANETITLTDLYSDTTKNKFVAHNFIDVYVHDPNSETEDDRRLTKWTFDPTGIFIGSSVGSYNSGLPSTPLYGRTDPIYTVSLNEKKQYQLRFGDGVIGKRLPVGATVYVIYLDTNGPSGNIDLADIDLRKSKFSLPTFSSTVYNDITKFGDNFKSISECLIPYSLSFQSLVINSGSIEESVDDIRYNAPNQFKIGNRLISASEYEYYIKNSNYVSEALDLNIVDVKCMNNIEYTATFYKWLYLMGINYHNDGRYYFRNDFLLRSDYKQVDPADGNNTYIWLKTDSMSSGSSLDDYDVNLVDAQLNNVLAPMKTMTTEIQVVKPILVSFDICGNTNPDSVKRLYLDGTKMHFDENCDSYIEITMNDNVIYTSTSITEKICQIITSEFDVNTCKMGQNINFSTILNQIYQLNGIQRVRTIYQSPDGGETVATDGLSFASWSDILRPIASSDYAKGFDDLEISNGSRHLEDFQFPRFVGAAKLSDRIKIIRKSLMTVNRIKQ